MGFSAPDPDQPESFSGSIDPSLFGDRDLLNSIPFGIPPLNFARGPSAAALLARALVPYAQAYEDFGVKPVRAIWNTVEPLIERLTDPGTWMAVQSLGPPGWAIGTVGGATAKGLRALAEIRTPGLPLSERADEILGALSHSNAIKNRTVAVLRTDGPTIVGSGGRDLDPIQRRMLQPGEVAAARLPGEHAEVTVLQDAQNQGATPSALGISRSNGRTICPTCQQAIESAGGRVDSPTTAVFPDPEWLPWIPPYRWP